MKCSLNEFEIAFYEGVLKQNPNHIDSLMLLAEAYTQKGLCEKGLALDQRLAVLCPDDPFVHYNLACSYALTGKTEEAFQSLEQAIHLGYSDFEHLRKDPDLKNLYSDSRFTAVLQKYIK